MHYCSRPSCRRWYHRACLTYIGASEGPDIFVPGSRPLRRLAVDPERDTHDVNEKLHALTFPRDHPSCAFRRKSEPHSTESGSDLDSKSMDADEDEEMSVSSIYDTLERVCATELELPESLVREIGRAHV